MRDSRTLGCRGAALFPLLLLVAACGGQAAGTNGSGGSSNGAGTGSTNVPVGSGGQSSTSSGSGGNTEEDCSCRAAPTCEEGERQDTRASACGTPCREVTVCCETIHCCPASSCGSAAENCEDAVCGPGEEPTFGECPPGRVCYQRGTCGTTITCVVPVTATGGTGSGGAPSGGATTAGTSAGGSGTVCCDALATCADGEFQFADFTSCGVGCREVNLCCQTIYCSSGNAGGQCNGIPACDEGDTQVDTCPDGMTCYERERCGETIQCVAGDCDPEPDTSYNRSYVAHGGTCTLIDYICEEPTTPFFNDCGCGCEQDQSCPEFVDCMPGSELDPLCDDTEACPYTLRAQ